jgi:hypothetical protein
VLLTH